jgi:CRP-like cAMP-binding protein
MSTGIATLLQQNPLFSVLSPDDIAVLAGAASSRRFGEGQWIALHGDVWPYLFIIERGVITAKKESPGGRSLLAAQFGAGDVFWGLAFFLEDAPMPAGLISSADTLIHLWSREYLLPVLKKNGAMAWQLSVLMVNRMLLASKIVEGLAFQPVAGRLASWLMTRYSEAGDAFVSRDLTLDEMAAHIGTTREMVCRALYRFAEEGAVQINRTEFKITDSEMLEQYIVKS